MAASVSVQYDGGSLPLYYIVDPMLLMLQEPVENPTESFHVESLFESANAPS